MKYLLLSIIMAGISLVGVPALADAGVSVELETTIVGGGSSFDFPVGISSGIIYSPIPVTIPYVNPVINPVVNPEPEKIVEPKVEPKKEVIIEPEIIKPEIVTDMSWVWFLIVPSVIVILAFLLYRKYRRQNL